MSQRWGAPMGGALGWGGTELGWGGGTEGDPVGPIEGFVIMGCAEGRLWAGFMMGWQR